MDVPIPPRHLLFMGGDQDPEKFMTNADDSLRLAVQGIDVGRGTILDVGCGYARIAYALMQKGNQDRYIGVDILKPQIDWLQENVTPKAPLYRFAHLDIMNGRYNPKGKLSPSEFRIEPGDGPVSIIFCQSVFTHMYEEDIIIYLKEFRRVMSADSVVSATIFLLNSPTQRPYKLEHQINDHCRFYDPNEPLHVIGYDQTWLEGVLEGIGLKADVKYGFQDRLELRIR